MQPESSLVAPSQEGLAQLVQKGSAALTEGDIRSALESFEKVIEAFPDRPEGHNNLGALYTSLNECEKAEENHFWQVLWFFNACDIIMISLWLHFVTGGDIYARNTR